MKSDRLCVSSTLSFSTDEHHVVVVVFFYLTHLIWYFHSEFHLLDLDKKQKIYKKVENFKNKNTNH
jgi:hypothetical protein